MSSERVGWILCIGFISFIAGPVGAAERVWIQENNMLWMMNTDGHRVTKRPIGETFGSNPVLMMDEPFGLVWALGQGKFGILDMRTPTWSPVVLVEGVPRDVQNFEVAVLDIAGSATGSAKERQYGEKLFSFAVVGGMVQSRVQQVRIGEDSASTARLKWVGSEWIQRNSGRKAMGRGQHTAFSEKSDTELSMAYQNCQAPGYCGRSVAFGSKSNLRLVITEAECESGECYLGCHVRDSRGRMAQPPNLAAFGAGEGIPAGSCRDFNFAPDGVHFSTRTELCSIKGSVAQCQPAPGNVLGWVNGSPISAP